MKIVFIKSHIMEASEYKWSTLLTKYRRKEFMTEDQLNEFNRMVSTCPIKARQVKQWTDPQESARQFQYYDSISTEGIWERLVARYPSILK